LFWRNDYTTLLTNPDVVIYNLSRPCFEPLSPIKCRLSNILYLSGPSCACAKFDILKYNGRRLYQCNEEDFSIQVLISSVLFQITTLQVNKEKLLIDRFYLFPCLCVSMLFKSMVEIKDWNRKSSSVYWCIRRLLYIKFSPLCFLNFEWPINYASLPWTTLRCIYKNATLKKRYTKKTLH